MSEKITWNSINSTSIYRTVKTLNMIHFINLPGLYFFNRNFALNATNKVFALLVKVWFSSPEVVIYRQGVRSGISERRIPKMFWFAEISQIPPVNRWKITTPDDPSRRENILWQSWLILLSELYTVRLLVVPAATRWFDSG